jgi:hypothetical protein
MKGLIFTMLVLGSFSVFATESLVNSDGADCGDRNVSEIISGDTSSDSSSSTGVTLD